MSQIDWSKAPADATHWEPDGEANPSWMKCDNLGWAYWDNEWFYFEGISASRVDAMIKRPTAWTGTGLPPVGIECEAFWPEDTHPQWYAFELLFCGKQHCVALVDDQETHYALDEFEREGVRFRPIRTPEQIAAEEREKGIHKMWLSVKTVEADHIKIQKQVCADLYDAGYRKVEGGAQ